MTALHPPCIARTGALALAALVTVAILRSLGGIADRQVDHAVRVLRAQGCTPVAGSPPLATRQSA